MSNLFLHKIINTSRKDGEMRHNLQDPVGHRCLLLSSYRPTFRNEHTGEPHRAHGKNTTTPACW